VDHATGGPATIDSGRCRGQHFDSLHGADRYAVQISLIQVAERPRERHARCTPSVDENQGLSRTESAEVEATPVDGTVAGLVSGSRAARLVHWQARTEDLLDIGSQ